MRKTHTQKVREAGSMRTLDEVRQNVPIFQTRAWQKRKHAHILKQIRQYQEAIKRRRMDPINPVPAMAHPARLPVTERKVEVKPRSWWQRLLN